MLKNKIPDPDSSTEYNSEIDISMPFSDQNIKDMETIFYETGTFYKAENHKNIHITRFDERVWKLFWQLGYEHGINDINKYNEGLHSSSKDEAKIVRYIDPRTVTRFSFNTIKAVVGVVATAATAGSGARGDMASNAIRINADNLDNYTTALLKKQFLYGPRGDMNREI